MEELFVYSLLCVIGYEKYDEYKKSLDCLFLSDISNEELLDLEGRAYKDAILHTLNLFNVNEKNIDEFGKQLMRALKPIYYESDIVEFGNRMYELWNRLPNNISKVEPFDKFSYADDCLSYGDEKQCRELYEEAFNYYEY